MKDEALENSLIYMYQQGWSVRRLSREYHCSRRRIDRIIQEHERQRNQGMVPKKPVRRTSKLDAYKEYIGQLLQDHKGITAQRIYELILQKGYQGKISILEVYVAGMRDAGIKETIRCVETAPGQRAAHDWSEYFIEYTGNKPAEEKVTFFSIILGYSRRQYIEVVEDKTQRTLFECLVRAFIYFDGVPHQIKSDNQKACVDRWECGQPIFNRHYLGFASHYGFKPLTINPGRPVENLKIERPFYYLETNFLNGRSFRNKEDLKDQLRRWLTEVNDLRKHRTTNRQPIEMYREEIGYFLALPNKHYDTSQIVYRVVNHESCVQWNGCFFYVPGKHLFKSCPVRITESRVIIYTPDFEPVAGYAVPEKGSKQQYIGLPVSHKYSAKINLAEVKQRLSAMGGTMEQYMEKLVQQKKDPSTMLVRLLGLKVTWSTEDILTAVNRALQHGVYDIKAIENFLHTHASPLNAIKTLFDQQADDEG